MLNLTTAVVPFTCVAVVPFTSMTTAIAYNRDPHFSLEASATALVAKATTADRPPQEAGDRGTPGSRPLLSLCLNFV